jgi:hypothetical protein
MSRSGLQLAPRHFDYGLARKIGVAIVALLVCLIIAPVASARTAFPVYGAKGDAGAIDECPAGQYFVGVAGNVGAWIDQITVYCAPRRPDGSIGGAKSIASRGGSGGGYKPAMCDKNEVIIRINVSRTGDYQTRGIDFTCKNVLTNATHVVYFGGNSRTDGDPRNMACGATEAATGMEIRWGKYVNGLGLICNDMPSAGKPGPVAGSSDAPLTQLQKNILRALHFSGVVGHCVKTDLTIQDAACPTPPDGQAGDGECTHFVQYVLKHAGARPPHFGDVKNKDYAWGNKLGNLGGDVKVSDLRVGDVLQLWDAQFTSPDKSSSWGTGVSKDPSNPNRHSAIYAGKHNGMEVLYEQNISGVRKVMVNDYHLDWQHSGDVIVFRPVPNTRR